MIQLGFTVVSTGGLNFSANIEEYLMKDKNSFVVDILEPLKLIEFFTASRAIGFDRSEIGRFRYNY